MFRKEFCERNKKSREDFTRKWKMPFAGIMLTIINIISGTVQNAVYKFVDEAKKKIKCEKITQQSFSDARAKIKWEAFEEIFGASAEEFYEDGEYRRYEGYRLFGIDGSHLQLPNLPEIRKEFGENNGCAMGNMTVIYDLLNLVTASAGIYKYSVGERESARELIKKIP
jgi:hypothetical protein